MIFLILFAIIAIIVISLNIHDSSNLDEIREYFEKKKCENIVYAKGKYKGICENEIMQVNNSFTLDIEKNKNIFKFDEIKNINKDGLTIIINKDYKIEFKEIEKLNMFQKRLEDKLNK